MDDLEQLTTFSLAEGSHENAQEGVCAMEAVAWLVGEPHTDHPVCVCPVIAAYVRNLNDNLDSEIRQRLIPYLPKLVGTVSGEHAQERAEYLARQAVTVFAPLALRAAGLHAQAEKLELLPADADMEQLEKAAYAATAAYAAADAAAAANAAAYAAHAAAAAYAAAAATAAAYAAANAAIHAADAVAFQALDGVLLIGKQAHQYNYSIPERVAAYKEMVGTNSPLV